ncbi:c3 protein [Cardiosporidium cionae]|uniref:C3 protein n=1 Tax=Cardiosporidium cionae TaxID=476202 RepID=A0ABQ7J762_9APIC|nr:c3 protein [Cardiosporidium cionae]|eukprot:KAF8819819.1 c3 protein [Cardiosporidium cionae]
MRETEIQTLPFSPDVKVGNSTNQEIFQLSDLSFDNNSIFTEKEFKAINMRLSTAGTGIASTDTIQKIKKTSNKQSEIHAINLLFNSVEDSDIKKEKTVEQIFSTEMNNHLITEESKPLQLSSINPCMRHIVTIQKILRGCFLQRVMERGRKKYSAVIKELQTIRPQQRILSTVEAEMATTSLLAKNSMIENLAGTLVAQGLDELSRGLLLQTSVRNIEEEISRITWEREMREARELGRRQAENRLRERENIVHNRLSVCYHQSVDVILDELLRDGVHISAKCKVLDQEKFINRHFVSTLNISEEKHVPHNKIVHELVHHTVIPSVETKLLRERWTLLARRHKVAADKALESCCINLCKRLDGFPVESINRKTEEEVQDS